MKELTLNDLNCVSIAGGSLGTKYVAHSIMNLFLAGVSGSIGAVAGALTPIGAANGASYAIIGTNLLFNAPMVLEVLYSGDDHKA